jgi:hypothetical protein
VSPVFVEKRLNPYHKDNFTSTYVVSSLWEAQNDEYCLVYRQQLLYYFEFQAPSFTEYDHRGPVSPLGFFCYFFQVFLSCQSLVQCKPKVSDRGNQLQCFSRNCWFFRPCKFFFLVNDHIALFCGLMGNWILSLHCYSKPTEEALRWCLEIYCSLGRQYHLRIPLYDSHTHGVLMWVHPQQCSAVEAMEHLMQTAVGHIPLQTFSYKCCYNCPRKDEAWFAHFLINELCSSMYCLCVNV